MLIKKKILREKKVSTIFELVVLLLVIVFTNVCDFEVLTSLAHNMMGYTLGYSDAILIYFIIVTK